MAAGKVLSAAVAGRGPLSQNHLCFGGLEPGHRVQCENTFLGLCALEGIVLLAAGVAHPKALPYPCG